jgi:DNA recombination protein RmuC
MGSALPWLLLAIALLQTALIAVLILRRAHSPNADLAPRLDRTDQLVRDEAERARRAASDEARQSREESNRAVLALGESLQSRIRESAQTQTAANDAFALKVERLAESVDTKLTGFQSLANTHREQLTGSLDVFRTQVSADLTAFGDRQQARFADASAKDADHASALRKELADLNERLSHALLQRVSQIGLDMTAAWTKFSDDVAKLSASVTQNLGEIRKDNEERLEKMRQTVDEKLHNTLEQRLGESFKLVSDRLENVQKGLGEMQALATGVGDLKKVLTNVKTRGTWGEVLLGNLLEQVLPPDHYAANVPTTGTAERVEYAVKLPGRGERDDGPVWLPIDSKFPKEDYERLVAAQEAGNPELAAASGAALDASIKKFAQDICTKYIETPKTTDFALMFLPSESLYAEVIRRTETVEHLQRKCRVIITGPTTLAALLSSLLMGFRTLAIQKRSSEVWEVLGAIKSEFKEYGKLMGDVQKKLQEASNKIDAVGTRTRAINRKLSGVEQLSDDRAKEIFPPTPQLEDLADPT